MKENNSGCCFLCVFFPQKSFSLVLDALDHDNSSESGKTASHKPREWKWESSQKYRTGITTLSRNQTTLCHVSQVSLNMRGCWKLLGFSSTPISRINRSSSGKRENIHWAFQTKTGGEWFWFSSKMHLSTSSSRAKQVALYSASHKNGS